MGTTVFAHIKCGFLRQIHFGSLLYILLISLPFLKFDSVVIHMRDVNLLSLSLLQLHHEVSSTRNQSASRTNFLIHLFMMHAEFSVYTQC